MKQGRQPSMNQALQMSASTMAAASILSKISESLCIKKYALTILKTRDGKIPTQEIELNREQVGIILLLTNPNPTWHTNDGRCIPLHDMADQHLENAINWMRRKFDDIDLFGDERSIEKQCISYIWLDKLEKEQERREKSIGAFDEEMIDFIPNDNDTLFDNIGDWPWGD